MPYKKPICDCDNELALTVHEMDSMDFRINPKGYIVKSSIKHAKETLLIELTCVSCGNLYDSQLDDKYRYLRGSIKRKGFD